MRKLKVVILSVIVCSAIFAIKADDSDLTKRKPVLGKKINIDESNYYLIGNQTVGDDSNGELSNISRDNKTVDAQKKAKSVDLQKTQQDNFFANPSPELQQQLEKNDALQKMPNNAKNYDLLGTAKRKALEERVIRAQENVKKTSLENTQTNSNAGNAGNSAGKADGNTGKTDNSTGKADSTKNKKLDIDESTHYNEGKQPDYNAKHAAKTNADLNSKIIVSKSNGGSLGNLGKKALWTTALVSLVTVAQAVIPPSASAATPDGNEGQTDNGIPEHLKNAGIAIGGIIATGVATDVAWKAIKNKFLKKYLAKLAARHTAGAAIGLAIPIPLLDDAIIQAALLAWDLWDLGTFIKEEIFDPYFKDDFDKFMEDVIEDIKAFWERFSKKEDGAQKEVYAEIYTGEANYDNDDKAKKDSKPVQLQGHKVY